MNFRKIVTMGLIALLVVGGFAQTIVYADDYSMMGSRQTSFREGSGTVDDPYMIYDVKDLQNMSDDLTAHYALANDIDASETIGWNGGQGFKPIGPNNDLQFTGSLDGKNHTITELYINRPTRDFVGLFGSIGYEGSIEHVGMVDNEIYGRDYVGGLAGANEGVIYSSYTTGSTEGEELVGGLVGLNYLGMIFNSCTLGNVHGIYYVGGLTGYNGLGFVIFSYATGNIYGSEFVGGLVGIDEDGMVAYSYATGKVTGDFAIGGFMGGNWEESIAVGSYATGETKGKGWVGGFLGQNVGNVSDSYARGDVTYTDKSYENIGGFVGLNYQATIINSYSTGKVLFQYGDDPDNKGFVGQAYHGGDFEMSGNFWDIQTSSQSDTAGFATGLTTEEMKHIMTYRSSDWDIGKVPSINCRKIDHLWNIVNHETYPFFSWEYLDAPFHSLNIHTSGEGTTSVEPGYYIVTAGTEIIIEAKPKLDHVFSNWTGDHPDGKAEETIITMVMDEDKNITAHFELFIAPMIYIISPEDDEILDTDSFTLQWEYEEGTYPLSYFEVRMNEGQWENTSLNTQHTFENVDDGERIVTVLAVDEQGFSNQTDINIIVDTSPPNVRIVSPENGDMFGVEDITVSWTGVDNASGIDYYDIRINSDAWINKGNDTYHRFIGLSSGVNNAELKAYDRAGNFALINVSFMVDLMDPIVNITSHTDGDILSASNVTIEWTGIDEHSGINYYALRIDKEKWVYVGNDTDYTLEGLEEGYHTVDIRVRDNVGNTVTTNVTFNVDITEPTINITSPKDGGLFADNSVTIEWTGNDNNSGIDCYHIITSEGNLTSTNTSYTFTGLSDGVHNLTIIAYDRAGNQKDDTVSIVIDTTPPDITIFNLNEGDILDTDSYTLQWAGTDETCGICHYEIRLNEGDWTNISKDDQYIFEDLEDGDYTITIKAVDNAGNEATSSVSFIVDTGLGPLMWLLIGVIVVVLVTTIFFIKKRYYPKKTEDSDPEADGVHR